jgi:hypothetical protein
MLFFSKRTPPASPTFKARVEDFWSWFATVAPRFYETIEEKKCASLEPEVSRKVDEILPGFAWVFGPGENGVGHSYTLSGDGNPHRQLLTAYWKSRAPQIAGWTFYASRPRSAVVAGYRLQLADGGSFDPGEFWITPTVDEANEKIGIHAWHPKFPQMEERQRRFVLFLLLDEMLGELGTQRWIGRMELSDARLGESMPLRELRPFVDETIARHGWKLSAPGEGFTLYRLESPHDRFPHGDIFIGLTAQFAIVDDYLEAKGELEDPLEGTGAGYVYVTFPITFLPEGEESVARGRLEEAVDGALAGASSGRCLGGAMGKRFGYLDALIFDGERSEKLIRDTLRGLNLPKESVIRYFAKSKRERVLALR